MKKVFYLIFLGLAFLGSALFWVQLPFRGDSIVVFHINSFGVTWRYIVDIVIIGALLWLFVISWQKFLVSVDAKHTTTISKR